MKSKKLQLESPSARFGREINRKTALKLGGLFAFATAKDRKAYYTQRR